MNGAGEGNIIFGDGLDNHKEMGIKNDFFDILVANPPYSIETFKPHLKLLENKLELIDLISNQGSKIEVLVVERILQLLKPNGIATVILPDTFLSSTQSSYKATRSIIIKNFRIISIVKLGNSTLGKTGKDTIIFFRKYNEPPKHYKIIEDNIQAIFSNQKLSLWKDDEILGDYIEHIGVDLETFTAFIEEIKNYHKFENIEYFKMYYDDFSKTTELKTF